MRSQILNEVKTPGRDYVAVYFSFAPNGSSAISSTGNKGRGVDSVARTSAGVFTLTLSADYADLVYAAATVQLATAADMHAQIGTYTAPTASANATLVVRTIAVATETDIAANANNRVNVKLVFRKSSVTP